MKKLKALMVSVSLLLAFIICFETPASALAPVIKASEKLSASQLSADEAVETSDLILCELKNERTENTKTFRLENGNNMVVEYALPVHYKNEKGNWTDYDNSLKEENKEFVFKELVQEEVEGTAESKEESAASVDFEDDIEPETSDTIPAAENKNRASKSETEAKEPLVEESGSLKERFEEREETFEVLSNKSAAADISFAKSSSERSMVLFDDSKNCISWGYQDVSKREAKIVENKEKLEGNEKYTVLTNLFSTVRYNSVYENVDIENISSPTGVKENIILNKKSAQNSFVIEYEIGELQAKQENENVIALLNQKGEAKYYISATYMFDNKGEVSHDVALNIVENTKGKLAVELIADKDWLQSEDREYPVTIDPSFITGQAWGEVQSSYIDSGHPNTCYGYSPSNPNWEGTMYAGQYYGKHRSFIKMNSLPALNNGDIIVDAELNLYLANHHVSSSGDFVNDEYTGVYEVTQNWEQGTITWNNRPSWNSTVIDYVHFTPSSTDDWYTWNVTKLFKKWYQNPSSNYGVMLKSLYEDTTQECAAFFSSNYPTTAQAHPAFTLTYRNNKGIESYWDYTSFDVGNAGTLYINNYSGTYTFMTNITSTADPVMPASLDYVYNSYMGTTKYNKTSPYTGFGWKMNIQQTLLSSTQHHLSGEAAERYPYVYTDADGTEHYFYKKGSGSSVKYYDEDGLGLELTIQSDSYTITDKDKNKLIFNSDGLLVNIKDSYNNICEIKTLTHTDTNINKIQDRGGKEIALTYNNSDKKYMLNVKDPSNRYFTFEYTTTENDLVLLKKINRPDGTSVKFGYSDSGYLNKIEDSDGYKIVLWFEGTSTKRVTQVKEYGSSGTVGQTLSFDHSGYNETVVQSSGPDGTYDTSDDVKTTYQFDNFGRAVSVQGRTKGGSDFGAENYEHTSGEVNSDASNIKKINRISGSHALGANAVNLIRNSNVESSSNWASSSWGGTSTFTWGCTNAHRFFGQKSYLINVTAHNNQSGGRVYQDLTTLSPDTTYVLSAYIKITSLVNRSDNYGAVIHVEATNGSGVLQPGKYSEVIKEKADTGIDDGWRRVSVKFKTPETLNKVRVNLVFYGTNGKAYFDAVQLEKGGSPSPYNMILNSSFEAGTYQPTNWDVNQNLSFGADGDTVSGTKYREGIKSFRILGDPKKVKTLSQEIPVSGGENDIYIVSSWGKADAVPTNTVKKFKISIDVFFEDGSHTAKNSANFNSCVSSWQFVSKAFDLSDGTDANKTPVKVRISLNYSNQANTAYFDNVSLVKEPAQSYTYDSDGNLVTVVDNAKQKSSLEYNSDNKLTKSVDPKGYDYRYTYNPNGKLATAKTQQGAKYTYEYDDKGSVTSVEGSATGFGKIKATQKINYPSTNPDEYSVESEDTRKIQSTAYYNANNGTLVSSTDPAGTTNYTYNSNNDLLTSVSRSEHSVSYNYDSHYKYLTGVTTPTANYSFSYNQFGLRTLSKVGNRTLASYSYYPDGSMQSMQYGNGATVNYEYDKYGNVSKRKLDNIAVYEGFADKTGAVTKEVDITNGLVYNYVYDSTDRLTGSSLIRNSGNLRLATYDYDYDLNNNVSKFTVITPTGSNSTSYTYKEDNLSENTVFDNSKTLHNSYDLFGRPTSQSLNTASAIETSYTYHSSAGFGSGYTTNLVRIEDHSDYAFLYQYDDSNNLIRVKFKLSDDEEYATLEEYTYDSLGQLTQVDYNDRNERHVFTYGDSGNLSTEKIYDISNASNPVLADTISYTYGDSDWKDLLTAFDGDSITYDAIGNPLTYRNGISLTWQSGRQLQSLTRGDNTIAYTYGANGMRLSKTVNGVLHTYLYNGDRLIQETIGDKILDFSYDANGNVTALRYKANANDEGTYYYYAHNTRGEVIALHSADGSLYAKYTYDVWGNPVSVKNAAGTDITNSSDIALLQPIRYRGYCFDSETGFYYLQSRYYDPVTHRFLNADAFTSTGQGILGNNMFAYCENNPVCCSDPTGHSLIAAIVVGVIMIASAVALSGCAKKANNGTTARKDLAKAPNLNVKKAKPKQYNCYGNGIGKQIFTNPSGYVAGDSTRKTFEAVKRDLGKNNVRELANINAPIENNEFKVALKCGPFDYHFIRQDSVGWYNKSGEMPGLYIEQSLVECGKWYPMFMVDGIPFTDHRIYYDDETIYFAVRIGWDEQ